MRNPDSVERTIYYTDVDFVMDDEPEFDTLLGTFSVRSAGMFLRKRTGNNTIRVRECRVRAVRMHMPIEEYAAHSTIISDTVKKTEKVS